MLKYTVTAKNPQGTILFTQKIEGKKLADKAFAEQVAREEVKSVRMTRWVVTVGVTETVKAHIK